MHTLVLGRSNIVGTDNNRLVYEINGSKSMEAADIALQELTMYYSWYNISSALNNNKFSIIIPQLDVDSDNAGITTSETTVTITIPDGLYEVADLQAYIEQWSIENNFYLINSTTGEYKYFLQIQLNPTRYALQFNSYALPSVATLTGYTQPTAGFLYGRVSGVQNNGKGGFPASATEAVGWYFPGDFYKFAGFTQSVYKNSTADSTTPGTYATTADFPNGSVSFLSETAYDLQPNSVIYLNCNLISNSYSNPMTFLYPISRNDAQAGKIITVAPQNYAWNKIMAGTTSQVVMTFTDRNGQPLKILDPNIVITLVIRDHSDKVVSMGPSVNGFSASMESQRYSMHPSHHNSDSHHNNFMRSAHAKTMY